MDKKDALALLDVMRMQVVHEPPGFETQRVARAISDVMAHQARQWTNVEFQAQPEPSRQQQIGIYGAVG